MTNIEKANDLFSRKFHCSQAVFAAFAEELGLTEEQALKNGQTSQRELLKKSQYLTKSYIP